jgi:hypothetical protein
LPGFYIPISLVYGAWERLFVQLFFNFFTKFSSKRQTRFCAQPFGQLACYLPIRSAIAASPWKLFILTIKTNAHAEVSHGGNPAALTLICFLSKK